MNEHWRRKRVERIEDSWSAWPIGAGCHVAPVLRFFVAEASLAWLYDYRIDWQAPVAPADSARVPADSARVAT